MWKISLETLIKIDLGTRWWQVDGLKWINIYLRVILGDRAFKPPPWHNVLICYIFLNNLPIIYTILALDCPFPITTALTFLLQLSDAALEPGGGGGSRARAPETLPRNSKYAAQPCLNFPCKHSSLTERHPSLQSGSCNS